MDTATAMAIVGVAVPAGGVVIAAILKAAPRLNGKYVPSAVCNERHKNTDQALARIEMTLAAIHRRLDEERDRAP